VMGVKLLTPPNKTGPTVVPRIVLGPTGVMDRAVRRSGAPASQVHGGQKMSRTGTFNPRCPRVDLRRLELGHWSGRHMDGYGWKLARIKLPVSNVEPEV
jgi:hypothetical protein